MNADNDTLSFLRKKTMGFRYSTVLALAKYLTPSLYREIVRSNCRGMVSFILNEYGQTSLTGVELGVHTGTHAYLMLSVLSIKKLFLVDPYLSYIDGNGKAWDTSNKNYVIAQRDLSKFKQCEFIKKTSTDAAPDILDDLDFVYIDANHNYEYVKADVETYYPKIRMGGVIGGHDFTVDFQGVIHAVVDFARQIGAKLHVEYPDWWIAKES
jgi:hypothetical protein